VRELLPEVPEGVGAVVARMMAKERGQRYQSPAEVLEALAPWTAGPVPPPAEEEIPRLSPAASAPSDGGHATPPRPPRLPGRPAPARAPGRRPARGAAAVLETPHPSVTRTPTDPAAAPLFAVSLQPVAPLAPGGPATAPAPAGRPAARQVLPALAVLASGVAIGLALSWMIRTAGLVAITARLLGP
jgi:hypothetical protein